jgi:predicted ATPase/DNA-binding SARP family transcriptional activator
MPQAIEINVLGAVDVRRGGGAVSVPGAKARTVLTLLGLNAGEVVSAETMQEVLWGEHAPRTAHKALQTHISTLRQVLGEGTVVTAGGGWMLTVDSVDARAFEEFTQAGRQAMRDGSPEAAVTHFSDALRLWRGQPELPPTVRAEAELTRWREARESVRDDCVDARLAGGEAAALVGEIEKALAADPLREKRWAQLCIALYRSGRQGDALKAYRRARSVLIDELGLEPSPELRRIEAAILNHDVALPAAAGATRDPLRGTRGAPDTARGGAGVPTIPALPAPPTAFIGRGAELARLAELLAKHRLVTIVGPGGVGKTRLAIAAAAAAAREFPEHVWFVDLAQVEADVVPETVAAAIGAAELASQPIDAAIIARIGVHRSLLLLDNCDHLLEAVSQLAQRIIAACPGTVVLATSRQRLGVVSEQVVKVPPMALSADDGADSSDAEVLFLDRAHASDPALQADPALVAEVCQRCDGLPLAIELAAARCSSLGVDGLLAGLDDHLRLLVGDHALTTRHRSLRAVLDWSYEYLTDDEQRMFRRLGLFVGSFDLTAAQALAPSLAATAVIDLLGRLTDKNLLVHIDSARRSRWRMLDVVRSYARDRLSESDEADEVRHQYLRWASDAATELDQRLSHGQSWRDDAADCLGDLRAALGNDAETWPDGGARLELALALARLQARIGAFTLAQSAYEEAMAMARRTGDATHLATAALGASEPGMLFGIMQAPRVTLLEEALVALGSQRSSTRVRLQARLATELYWSTDHDRSRSLADEAVAGAAELSDPGALAHALYAHLYVTRGPGTSRERLALAGRITRAARQSGESQLELAGLAAHSVSLLEAGDLTAMDADITELAEAADRLDHPEFQWYAAVYRLVQALVAGNFDEADGRAAVARSAAAHAPEFAVGLYFAEAVTDLRERDKVGLRRHSARLSEMAGRYPRILIWRCLNALTDLARGAATDVDSEIRDLTAELLGQDARDGHWLVACCLVAEAVAELDATELAAPLESALRPFADQLAVAGRVAAFRGSVAHPLGRLSMTLGNHEQALADLDLSVAKHDRIGALPFRARDVAILDRLRTQ